MTYYSIPRLWPGETVACVASGPSLTREDCEYLRGKVRVIAVNDGIRYTQDFADVLYSSDWRWVRSHNGCPDFHGIKIAIEQGRGSGFRWYQGYTESIGILKNTGAVGLDRNPDSIRNYANSGSAAIHVAYHFGAARVLLLGYNFGFGPDDRRHFHGDVLEHELNATDRHRQQTIYDGFIRRTEQLVQPLKDAGVEVINCTEGSRLTCFPFMPLREALPESAEVAA